MRVDPEDDPLCDWNLEQSHNEIAETLPSATEGTGITHPAMMMPREAVGVGSYKKSPAEDRDLFLRPPEHGWLANLP